MSFATKINLTSGADNTQTVYPKYRLPQSPAQDEQSAAASQQQPVSPTQVKFEQKNTDFCSWKIVTIIVAVIIAIILIIIVIILAVKLSQKSDSGSQASTTLQTSTISLQTSTLNGSMTLLDWVYSPDLSNPQSSLFVNTSLEFCQQIESLVTSSAAYTHGGCSVIDLRNGSVEVEYFIRFTVRANDTEDTVRQQLAKLIAEGVSANKMNSQVRTGYFKGNGGNRVDNCVPTNNCTLYQNTGCFTTLESYVCYCRPGYEQSAPNTDCYRQALTSTFSNTGATMTMTTSTTTSATTSIVPLPTSTTTPTLTPSTATTTSSSSTISSTATTRTMSSTSTSTSGSSAATTMTSTSTPISCNETQFRCSISQTQCVPLCKVCDGVVDCKDETDETNCSCGNENSFRCHNSQCISTCKVCDSRFDCTDGSDELNCSYCFTGDFHCASNNSFCVQPCARCDGKYDCPDASDEFNCTCAAGHFQCRNGQCIRSQRRCDRSTDCFDGSDEIDCPCQPNEFRCSLSGLCVPLGWFCDGDCHCANCTDEPANCSKVCPPDQFMCPAEEFCVESKFRCDGWCYCDGCFDETNCVCRSNEFSCEVDGRCLSLTLYCDGDCHCPNCTDEPTYCSKNCSSMEFRCETDGRCVLLNSFCDGRCDCSNCSDDEPLNCTKTCEAEEFLCKSGKACVDGKQRCDGWCSCSDCSDEENCANMCPHRELKCDNGWCLLTKPQCSPYGYFDVSRCPPEKFWCDGYNDCLDSSDEKYCIAGNISSSGGTASCSGPGKYSCADGWCISLRSACTAPWCQHNFRCDGYTDCPDGSDELSCASHNSSVCRPGEFQCNNSTVCIDRLLVCNGAVNCRDKSDELNCDCPYSGQFRCGSGECVYSKVQCDGKRDCLDGSDEICNCTSDEFQCANGQCVKVYSRCLGLSYCKDYSDQANCTCGANQFRCPDAVCISSCQVCDGVSDCIDSSDELHCLCDSVSKFRCKSGQCIDACKRCDGNIDCSDWSDETNCSCRSHQFRCSNGRCIPACQVCDGYSQCSDDSDELNCTNINKCGYSEFRCVSNGSCIPAFRRCDGRCDCGLCTDEADCSTPPPYYLSTVTKPVSYTTAAPNSCKGSFQCIYGGPLPCISTLWVCNGICDCFRCTDEIGCNCTSSQFECKANGQCVANTSHCDLHCDCVDDCSDEVDCDCHKDGSPCTNGRCYYRRERCDGVNNCGDYTDELNCTCGVSDFQCAMGLCLDSRVYCNGTRECPDGSDEPRSCSYNVCLPKQFTCHNSRCIEMYRVCNGLNDCGDYSDETNCSTCPVNKYKCEMGLCVPESTWCDGYNDCPDGSDEIPNCNTSCPRGSKTRRQCLATGKCLESSQVCDGVQDCPDDSDEANCSCLSYQYPCINGRCIYRDWLCDGVKDCPLGDDESPAVCNSCNSVDKFTCVRNYTICINTSLVCDGTAQCTDTSDESQCFSLNETLSGSTDKLLVVKYRGLSGYYVCADQWTNQLSDGVCQQLGYDFSALATGSVNISALNISRWLVAKNGTSFSGNILTSLQPSSCTSQLATTVTCATSVCGRRASNININPYIVGGNWAARGAWPWQVMVKFDGTFQCGGSLINDRWILTAAHCTHDTNEEQINATRYQIRLGAVLADDPDPDAVYSTVTHVFTHPQYSRTTLMNDVGLLRLSSPINYTDTIRPVCLPTRNVNLDQFKVCVDTGFGKLSAYGPVSSRLLQVRMNILPFEICSSMHPEFRVDNNTMICIGSLPAEGPSICYGDSGGPFVCKDQQDMWTIIGVNSFGFGDCEQSVVARTATFISWIEQTITSIS